MTAEALGLLGANLGLVVLVAIIFGWLMYVRLRGIPPSPSFTDLEASYSDLSEQVGIMREQQAADHATIRQLRTEFNRLDTAYMELRQAFISLAHEFMSETGKAPATQLPSVPPAATPASVTTEEPAKLAKLIVAAFSLDEMTGLAFELGIDGSVNGDTTTARARSLVGQANRRGLMERLITLCREQRPGGGF